MNKNRYRKYPRAYKKNTPEHEDQTLELSAAAAVGVLAFTLANGIALGYFIKKKLG